MKKVDDKVLQKLLEICKYIKWTNLSQEEYDNIKNKA